MRFEWVREGPAETCRNRCREWVSAVGQIIATTASDFAVFARSSDLKGATIVLDSSGGHALVSLELGREFRRLGVTTTVGHTVNLPPNASGDQRATLSPRGRCASACTEVLLGGIRRNVPDEVQITVHQPWSNSKRDDTAAATYPAREMVELTRLVGQPHPLTIDGQEIGNFEIALFCGTAPGTMQIFYSEKRTSASGSPDRVVQVIVAVGRERESLAVESSVAGRAPGEIVSTARASVPASCLRALAEPARPPFIIATQTASRVRAQVRMGAAGLADNLVTLLGSCPR
jgi:hypothetical protein